MKIFILKCFFLLYFCSPGSCQENQKSLLIVFDGTGSMGTDLAQLRAGANDIIKDFSSRETNPIYNYVLSIFRDPDNEPVLNTRNPNDILDRLAKIVVSGGGDCPELAITGLKSALDHALPNSLAFVFTDASAKDYALESEVLRIVQSKQVSVNFLITGDCGERGRPSFNVYQNIASASNGQVYDMKRTDISKVLEATKIFADDKYTPIGSIVSDTPGTREIEVSVDQSIIEIIVSVSGTSPVLNIKNPKNETVELGCKLVLDSLIFGCVKNPIDGTWIIVISASSSYSIKLGAMSELKLPFGFSIEPVTSIDETSIQPLNNVNSIFSIFPDKPEYVGNLTHIKVITIPSSPSGLQQEFEVPLRKINEKIYASGYFNFSGNSFKIIAIGYDPKNNSIERLLTTTLTSIEASRPEVSISAKESRFCESGDISLKCGVKSMISATVTWFFNDKEIQSIAVNQSREVELVIKKITVENSGNYSCAANNTKGSARSNAFAVNVAKSPKIFIPELLIKYINYTVKCSDNDTSFEFYPNDEKFLTIAEKCVEEIVELQSEHEELKEALNSSLNTVLDLDSKLEKEIAKNSKISEKLKNKTEELSCCNKNVTLLERQLKTCKKNLKNKGSNCCKDKCCSDERENEVGNADDDNDDGSNESLENPKKCPKKKPCNDKNEDSDESRDSDRKKKYSKIFEFLFKFKN